MATVKGWRSERVASKAARRVGGRVLSQDAGDGTLRHVVVQAGCRASDRALMIYGAGGAGYVEAVDLDSWQREGRSSLSLLP